jgi:hypothetical protein
VKRPEMPELTKGMELLAGSSPVIVVGLGPKWITVVAASAAADYQADPRQSAWRTRRFLRADLREGEPARRIGSNSPLRTAEQRDYDDCLAAARGQLARAGLTVERGSWASDDQNLLYLAAFLREAGAP